MHFPTKPQKHNLHKKCLLSIYKHNKQITFSFPVFQFFKKLTFINRRQRHVPDQLFHLSETFLKLGWIPFIEDTVSPIIPCYSDITCRACSSREYRNPTKQRQHSWCITVIIKGSELRHVLLNIQPSKVHMGLHPTIKQRIIESSTMKPWTNIISIDILIFQQLFGGGRPLLKTTKWALNMYVVADL